MTRFGKGISAMAIFQQQESKLGETNPEKFI